jgi:hypothetical protein
MKDWARIEAFIDQGAVDLARLKGVLDRFGLLAAWRNGLQRAGKPDPLL